MSEKRYEYKRITPRPISMIKCDACGIGLGVSIQDVDGKEEHFKHIYSKFFKHTYTTRTVFKYPGTRNPNDGNTLVFEAGRTYIFDEDCFKTLT